TCVWRGFLPYLLNGGLQALDLFHPRVDRRDLPASYCHVHVRIILRITERLLVRASHQLQRRWSESLCDFRVFHPLLNTRRIVKRHVSFPYSGSGNSYGLDARWYWSTGRRGSRT